MTSDSTLKYATVLDLAQALGIRSDIPSWDTSGTPANETVGTGNGATSAFTLDHICIIYGSCILYYGATSATTTTLTETTHYTLALDTGIITLTAAGISLVSTSNIYAKYSYINNGMKSSYLVDVLYRSETELSNMLNSTFTDGSATNPTYPLETEIQPSQGFFGDRIITRKKPLIDISTTLLTTITDVSVSVVLASGAGASFPSSGKVIIESEVISYTGITTDTLTGCSRAQLGTTAAAHTSGVEIHSTIFFRSDTDEGTAVSWTVQPWNTSMYVDANGLIYKFKDSDPDPLLRRGVANRVKILYYYGYSTIPQDIKRLNILLAKRMLIQDNIGKAMVAGRNEFRPEMFNVDMEEMERIKNSYIVLPMGNT